MDSSRRVLFATVVGGVVLVLAVLVWQLTTSSVPPPVQLPVQLPVQSPVRSPVQSPVQFPATADVRPTVVEGPAVGDRNSATALPPGSLPDTPDPRAVVSADVPAPGASSPLPGSADLEHTSSQPGGLHGRVLVGGEPTRVTWVRAMSVDGEVLAHSPPIDDDGRYELTGLPAGTVRVQVGAWRRPAPVFETVLVVAPGVDELRDLAFDDPRLPPIRGRVIWSDGEPARGVTVEVMNRRLLGPDPIRDSTDWEGRFELEAWGDEPHMLMAVAVSGAASGAVHAEPGDTDVEIVLPVQGTLVLELVDGPSGGAFDGALLRASSRADGSLGSIRLSSRGVGEEGFGMSRIRFVNAQSLATVQLPPGRCDLLVDSADAGYAPCLVRDVEVPPKGVDAPPLRVVLDRGERVGWRFMDPGKQFPDPPASAVYVLPAADVTSEAMEAADGDALAKALGMARWQLEASRLTVSSDGDGWLALPRGPYRLVFVPPVTSSEPRTFTVPRADTHAAMLPFVVTWER